MGKQETLETIWEVPDELWERIEPIILEEDPPKARGRKRSDPRQMLNGIIFRLRSGCLHRWVRDGRLDPVDGEGGPLSIVVAGANVHAPRRNPNTCVLGYREHIRRIGAGVQSGMCAPVVILRY